MIDSLSKKVQQLERYVKDSDAEKQRAMFDMLRRKILNLESQKPDSGVKKKQQTTMRRGTIASLSVPSGPGGTDDCSLLQLDKAGGDTRMSKKQCTTHNYHRVAFANYLGIECRKDLAAPMDTSEYVDFMCKKYITAWWQERCKDKGVACPTRDSASRRDRVKLLWNEFVVQLQS